MKKIFFILLIVSTVFVMLHSAYTDPIISSGINSTYKRLMFLYADSLVTTDNTVKMGNGELLPFQLSTGSMLFTDTNPLEFDTATTYIYSPSADNLTIKASSGTLTLDSNLLYLGSSNNDIDSNDDFTLAGDLDCVDISISGDMTITDDVTADSAYVRTMKVSGATELTGNVTASGYIDGQIGASAVRDPAYFSTLTANDAVTLTGSGTGLAVTNNQTVGGTFAVTGTSEFTDVITATAGVTGDLTGDVTGDITGDTFTDATGDGVTVDDVLLYNGDILLNAESNFISFDADDNTYLTAKTADDNISVFIGGVEDFNYSANTYTALSGSSILTNKITETTAETGVTVDGCKIESKTNITNIFPASGLYVAITATDVAEGADPTSHSLTDNDDLYVSGLLEVDDKIWADGALTVAGTTTLGVLEFSGDNPEINPSATDGATGKNLIIHGGDGASLGGDLELDGGSGTTGGDVLLGSNDGNISINAPVLYEGYATITCDGSGGEEADLTEAINYIIITANDTITVADGVEGQTISFITESNSTTFDAHIQAVSSNFYFGTETILDSKTAACELIFHKTKWYIKSITD